MSNPNNIIRPPVLAPQAGNDRQLSVDDLRALITNIATDILQQQGPRVVQATLNPNAFLNSAIDQTIEDRHRGNLADLDKIPDVVKCLKDFSGRPGEFNSWKKSVDRILSIYEPLKGTPKYYGILSVIRNKITGNADTALESYNTPLDWSAIVKCLAMHYADKRDISTLEYQLTTLVQGNKTITEFYQQVYKYLSLILNKLGCVEMGSESLRMMTQSYRDKALDTFVRGLNGDLPRLLGIREPADLPQALHLCMKLDNQNYRTNYAQNIRKGYPNSGKYPTQQQSFYPQLAYEPQVNQTKWKARPQFFNQNQSTNAPPRPPRPQPKPEPMEVDQSLHSRKINYMNRPHQNQFQGKRPPSVNNQPPTKNQRTFYIDTSGEGNQTETEYDEHAECNDVHFLA